jgi:hypothetical protein
MLGIIFNVNTQLTVELLVILWIVNALCSIALGIAGTKKSTHYNWINALFGVITLIVVFIWLV